MTAPLCVGDFLPQLSIKFGLQLLGDLVQLIAGAIGCNGREDGEHNNDSGGYHKVDLHHGRKIHLLHA